MEIAIAAALVGILTPVAVLIYKIVYNVFGKIVDALFGKKEKLIFEDVNKESILKAVDSLGQASNEYAKLKGNQSPQQGKTYKIKSGNVNRLKTKSSVKRVRK